MNYKSERGFMTWILIIIGVLIVLVLVGYFSVDRKKTEDSGVLPRAVQPNCGLVVNQPLENSKVIFPLQVSGYLKSCNVSPITGNYGTVQVIDSNALLLSAEVHLPIVGNWVGQPAPFSVLVTPKTKPTTDSGFLVFRNHNKEGSLISSFQIPILFIQ